MMRGTACIAALACVGAVASANIQVNGGFEMGTGTDSAGWTEGAFGAAGAGSERVNFGAASGAFAHRLSAVGNSTTGSSAGITQNSIADGGMPSLLGGSMVSVSFLANVDLGPGGVGFFALRVLDGNGAIVADSTLQALGPTGGAYQAFSFSGLAVPAFGAAPNDVYAAFVEIFVSAGAFDGSLATAFIDDVVIRGTVVPTPGAMACLGLAGVLAAGRRRN